MRKNFDFKPMTFHLPKGYNKSRVQKGKTYIDYLMASDYSKHTKEFYAKFHKKLKSNNVKI